MTLKYLIPFHHISCQVHLLPKSETSVYYWLSAVKAKASPHYSDSGNIFTPKILNTQNGGSSSSSPMAGTNYMYCLNALDSDSTMS